ncbi:unnamed protein product [Trichobilharzia szidati]|nr:unnamed protein product [Trichobilharzia szidati]
MPKLKSTSKPSKSISIHTTTTTTMTMILLLFASFFLLICILLEYQLTIHEIILTYYYIQHEQISDPQIIHEQKLITQDTCKSICQRIPKISKSQLKSHGNISEMLSPKFNANLQALSNLSYPHLSGGAWIYKVKEDNDDDNNTDVSEDRYCDVLPEDGVAIIIPFPPNQAAERQQLYATLSTLIPLLQRQRLCYRIFVIESLSYINSDDNNNNNYNYNKGKLLNVGFVEAMKLFQFHCVIFHDINLAPVNYYNSYQCDTITKYSMIHLSMAINDSNNNNLSKFKPPYTPSSSYRNNGVVKLTAKNFITVNGYSNVYWNAYNDIEYHYDFIKRLKTINVEYRHVNEKIGQYILTSSSNKWENTPQLNGNNNNNNNNMNINHLQVTESTESRMNYDGLNNLAYKVISRLEEPFFTYISVLI